jgi:iron-sulfur cluster insertion protein
VGRSPRPGMPHPAPRLLPTQRADWTGREPPGANQSLSLGPVTLIDAGPPSTLTIMNATSDALAEIDPPPPEVLVFTDAAAGKVGELIREEANPNLKLRVFVSGGGCSGFQYGFTFDEKIEEGDFCVEKRGVQLLIDPMSAQYLMGAEIDYKEDIQGAQFVIRNPNAKTTCGCGSSFSA